MLPTEIHEVFVEELADHFDGDRYSTALRTDDGRSPDLLHADHQADCRAYFFSYCTHQFLTDLNRSVKLGTPLGMTSMRLISEAGIFQTARPDINCTAINFRTGPGFPLRSIRQRTVRSILT
jgi:hypothetical protein